MPRDKRHGYRGYRLISTYLKLQQQEEIEEAYNEAFNRRLKGFHIFCVIMFGAFLLDGVLPLRDYPTQVLAIKVIDNEYKNMSVHDGAGELVTPIVKTVEIITPEGTFQTSDLTGYEKVGDNVVVEKSYLFRARRRVHFVEENFFVYHYLNFHGNMIFWPLGAFLVSLAFLMIRRYYGSNTLSVIALLNIVPFFAVLYMA